MVHLKSEAHVLITALKEHVLCEEYGYKLALIVMVLGRHMSIIEHSCVCTYCALLGLIPQHSLKMSYDRFKTVS